MKINIELETYCHKLISRGLCRTVGEISHGQFNLVYHSNTGVVCFHPAKILVEITVGVMIKTWTFFH